MSIEQKPPSDQSLSAVLKKWDKVEAQAKENAHFDLAPQAPKPPPPPIPKGTIIQLQASREKVTVMATMAEGYDVINNRSGKRSVIKEDEVYHEKRRGTAEGQQGRK